MALDRAGRLDQYGRENIVATLDEALAVARAHIASRPTEKIPVPVAMKGEP